MVVDASSNDLTRVFEFIEKTLASDVQNECFKTDKNAVQLLNEYLEERGYDLEKLSYQSKMRNNGYSTRLYYGEKFISTAFKDYKEQAENAAASYALDALKGKMIKL